MKQDVFFIFDTVDVTRNNAVWFYIRNYFYDLRKYSFEKNADLRIAFATLENNNSKSISFFLVLPYPASYHPISSKFYTNDFFF